MLRTSMIGFVAVTALGLACLAPTTASAGGFRGGRPQSPPEKPPVHLLVAHRVLPNFCVGSCYPATLGPGRNVFAGPLVR